MKRSILILSIFCLFGNLIYAQTSGTLSVSVTTSATGGNYAPRNVLAIWIEDNSGKFVKTLLAYANKRKQYLNIWETSTNATGSMYNSVDAITAVTQSSHATRTCSWNGTDYNKQPVPDGTYKLRMELTDKNATGNTGSFSFTKGPDAQQLNPSNVPSFSSISLKWASVPTKVNPYLTSSNTIVVYPNPGSGLFTILGENIKSVKVTDLSGKIVAKSQSPVIDIRNQTKGVYFFIIETDNEITTQKILKE